MKHDLAAVQAAIRAEGLAGWLLYDFRGANPIALELLAVPPGALLTRRFFYWIPAAGEPLRLQSSVEAHHFAWLPGRQRLFKGWRELEALLGQTLPQGAPIAMEYSPGGALPTVSYVDGGTLEWLRGLGLAIVSSAELVQRLEAPWSAAALAGHRRAAAALESIRRGAIARLRSALAAGEPLSDHGLQTWMLAEMTAAGLETNGPPIVAFGPDSGNPHHSPDRARPRWLAPEQAVLLDYWGRLAEPGAVYADFTWMAYAGSALPPAIADAWSALREARDAALAFLAERFAAGESPQGREVDALARARLAAAGYGEAFVHRLGHSIGREDHGPGANLDDLETREERRLIEGVAFSIEPGIYTPAWGLRTEVNALHWQGALLVSGELQTTPELLLA
ncbi:aminopeptidase P family protein [bacterium]|nr:aminopeptidase P family protein [bacterium]